MEAIQRLELDVCRCCLATDNTMFNLNKNYEELLNFDKSLINDKLETALKVCYECAAQLQRFHRFRIRCEVVGTILSRLLKLTCKITLSEIKCEQTKNNLGSLLSVSKTTNVDVEPTLKDSIIKKETNHITGDLIPKDETVIISLEEKYCLNVDNIKLDEDRMDTTPTPDDNCLNFIDRLKKKKKAKKIKVKDFNANGDRIKLPRANSKRRKVLNEYTNEILLTKEEVLPETNESILSANYEKVTFKCDLCLKGFRYQHTYSNHMRKHDSITVSEIKCEESNNNLGSQLSNSGSNHVDVEPTLKDSINVKNETIITCDRIPKDEIIIFSLDETDYLNVDDIKLDEDRIEETVPSPVSSDDNFLNVIASKNKKKKAKKSKVKDFNKNRDINTTKRLPRANGNRRKVFKEEYATEILLTKEEQLAEMNARKLSVNYVSSAFKCDLCSKGFRDQNTYSNHMRKHNSSTGNHLCELCHSRFCSLKRLRGHRIATHERRYRCNQCQYMSRTTTQAKEHNKWHLGVIYQCEICMESFSKPTTYFNHLRKIHPTNFVCTICGMSFTGERGLAMHKQRAHLGVTADGKGEVEAPDSERYCKDCDITFQTAEAMERHFSASSRHNTCIDIRKLQFVCKMCGVKHEDRASLNAHLKKHGQVVYRRKPQKTKEQSVVEPQHRHLCPSCPLWFKSPRRLALHSRAHGSHVALPFMCEVCGHSFSSKDSLKNHIRSHTGEKPIECEVCSKRFRDRGRLYFHMRVHTNERPYSCRHCDMRFKLRGALNRHESIHTGVRRYACKHCGKGFTQLNVLKAHVNSRHLNMPTVAQT